MMVTRSKAQKKPKVQVKTHKLQNPRTGEMEECPLYADKDVGLAEKWVSDLQIEARRDDDVDTDDEVYDHARDAVRNDFKAACHENRKANYDWSKFVNNCGIEQRVAMPDYYDRDGKYRTPPGTPSPKACPRSAFV
jgi:hypothetical protein